ncbi:glycosyltransferase family 2 protein [uncultured Desulfuromonas sp.]|uniref:glycosyltransferase family 2 protein n=2 Tax=Desulfuromonas TaxID=890 RepID=UPI00260C2390|nr:glycosyltransferase family 2 protein [uncultured Desulfuromonas sp.]
MLNRSLKVSVVVPSYNSGKYIKKCLVSVLKQTIQDFEIVVVDDCSKDDTVSVVQGLKDSRIKIFKNEENRGPSYSRNKAIENSCGEWIAFLDSDDWFSPQRLEKLLSLGEETGAEIVADDIFLIEDNEEKPWGTNLSQQNFKKIESIDVVKYVGMDCGVQPMIKAEFLRENKIRFDESYKNGEDFLLLVNCLLLKARFFITTDPYYYYRKRRGSLTTEKINGANQKYEILKNLLDDGNVLHNTALENTIKYKMHKVEQSIKYHQVVEPLKKGDYVKSFKNLVKNPKVLIFVLVCLPKIIRLKIRKNLLLESS